jgi:hypothetical protein
VVTAPARSATLARVTSARDFALCGMNVTVGEIEGTVQLMFGTDGWPESRRKVMANVFANRATPGELRALADYLDGLALEDEAMVR